MKNISAKRLVLLGLFVTLWIAVLVTATPFDWRSTVRKHPFISTETFKFATPGFVPAEFDDQFKQASSALKVATEAGYALRLAFNLIPTWLLHVQASDKDQLVVREEVSDEFASQRQKELIEKIAQRIAERAQSFQAKSQTKIALMFVPTKIAANQLVVASSEARATDAYRFELKSESPRVGSLANQAVLEESLQSKGLKLISVVANYRHLQQTETLLYPAGESHWDGIVLKEIGPTVIRDLVSRTLVPAKCGLASGPKLQPLEGTRPYFGDLFEALGWRPNFPAARRFESQIKIFDKASVQSRRDKSCPTLVIAGTSYGASALSGIQLADALQNHYLGNVIDKSVPGREPDSSLEEIERAGLPPNTVVLWEFPFRYAKKYLP